jgi:hypothetical protein
LVRASFGTGTAAESLYETVGEDPFSAVVRSTFDGEAITSTDYAALSPRPPMKVDAATLAGGSSNQDAYAVLDRALVILDGSSTYPPRPLVGTVSGSLKPCWERFATGSPTRTLLAHILADAIAHVRDDRQLQPGGPSSTVLMTRINDDTLNVLVLGRLHPRHPVLRRHLHRNHRRPTSPPRGNRATGVLQQLCSGGGYDSQHARLLADLQAAQRISRNHPEGYWIAESERDAARHAISRTFPLDKVQAPLLLTDGAAAGVTTYGTPSTWPELIHQVASSGTQQVLEDLHQLEETDPAGQRWPRAKPHDDKTAILVRSLGPEPSDRII